MQWTNQNSREARENVCERVIIGLVLLLIGWKSGASFWHQLFSVVMQNQLLFDTLVKAALFFIKQDWQNSPTQRWLSSTCDISLNFKTFALNRQLPNEARLFAQVDKSWKDIMRRTTDKPNALRASTAAGKWTIYLFIYFTCYPKTHARLTYSCFGKICPTKTYGHTWQCRKVSWVMVV